MELYPFRAATEHSCIACFRLCVPRYRPYCWLMLDKRKAKQLLGETTREIGVLALVFIPLDILLAGKAGSALGLALGIMGGLLLIGIGIIAESSSEEPE